MSSTDRATVGRQRLTSRKSAIDEIYRTSAGPRLDAPLPRKRNLVRPIHRQRGFERGTLFHMRLNPSREVSYSRRRWPRCCRVSYMRAATTSADAAVRPATAQIAALMPNASAITPETTAPTANPASHQSR